LEARRDNPAVKGKGHAITGLIFASIGLLINVGMWLLIIAAFANRR
jgi:hypothetical protein